MNDSLPVPTDPLALAALRLTLGFPLVALAVVLLRLSFDSLQRPAEHGPTDGSGGPLRPTDWARRPAALACALALVALIAGVSAPTLRLGALTTAVLAVLALALLLASLVAWRAGRVGREWRALQADPAALWRLGVDLGQARLQARLLALAALALAGLLLAEAGTVPLLLPLAALLLAVIEGRLPAVLLMAALLGAISAPAALAGEGLARALPHAAVALFLTVLILRVPQGQRRAW